MLFKSVQVHLSNRFPNIYLASLLKLPNLRCFDSENWNRIGWSEHDLPVFPLTCHGKQHVAKSPMVPGEFSPGWRGGIPSLPRSRWLRPWRPIIWTCPRHPVHGSGGFQLAMGCPNSWMGLFQGKSQVAQSKSTRIARSLDNPDLKWMMTGGSP